jgi:PiT family inorganic phosphate transporter
MEAHDVVLVLVVVTALAFDFTNGFHDTANAMATSIATKALKPKVAVGLAGLLNFVGAFISLKVAATIAKDIVDPNAITPAIILAGLLGGIFWNLLTWRLSRPATRAVRDGSRCRGCAAASRGTRGGHERRRPSAAAR